MRGTIVKISTGVESRRMKTPRFHTTDRSMLDVLLAYYYGGIKTAVSIFC
jgi:hypothetical protein